MADKPRILQDGKDLIWSLIALGVIVLVVAGIAGSCSWGFGSDATEQKVPHFDVSAGLHADANTMPFPIREPKVPDGWQPNSGSTQEIEKTISSNVGWITDGGAYIQLTQTDAAEEDLMRTLLGDDTSGTGTRDVGGQMWVAYENLDHQKAWIVDLGDVRVGVKSRGKDESMQTLAEAVLAAQPLKADRPVPTG
ncbi:DUF4245 domain-containing protein [Gordonia sp. (in: high G+C Gram-positive bacteria)]|uniref:DUF4245 domain-containing protein n=1 Tax=Gordonia sp. (in: high G+C Gram-positive bacteria) TaxID=84139 RepID=UPI003F9C4F63